MVKVMLENVKPWLSVILIHLNTWGVFSDYVYFSFLLAGRIRKS
jgi:hypothetical protein